MELYIEPHRPERNPLTGRFNKGRTPHNKGKKRSEWMSKEHEEKLRQAVIAGNKKRKDYHRWNSKAVVMIDNDGRKAFFDSMNKASVITGICATSIRKTCYKLRHTAGGYKWFFVDDEELINILK